MKICDACMANAVRQGERPHGSVFGANEIKWVSNTCGACGTTTNCVERTDLRVVEGVVQEITKQKIEQRISDLINLEKPIQDFIGWALSLDQTKFTAVLEEAGHHAPKYQAEKWEEFQKNSLAFVWNWTPVFVAAWLARK